MEKTLRFMLLISAGISSCLANTPNFISHPRSQIILPRHRLTLNCSVSLGNEEDAGNLSTTSTSMQNVSSIKWILNGSRIGHDEMEDGAHVDNFSLVNIHYPSPNESVLIIERFNQSYDGVYQCLASFGHRHASSLLSEPASVTSACKCTSIDMCL